MPGTLAPEFHHARHARPCVVARVPYWPCVLWLYALSVSLMDVEEYNHATFSAMRSFVLCLALAALLATAAYGAEDVEKVDDAAAGEGEMEPELDADGVTLPRRPVTPGRFGSIKTASARAKSSSNHRCARRRPRPNSRRLTPTRTAKLTLERSPNT
jgi:hypothetical protein